MFLLYAIISVIMASCLLLTLTIFKSFAVFRVPRALPWAVLSGPFGAKTTNSATPKRAGDGRQSVHRFGDGPAIGGLPRVDPRRDRLTTMGRGTFRDHFRPPVWN
jgi:hypothetical protein